MKLIFVTIFSISLLFTQAQTLEIFEKDGSKSSYKADNIQNISLGNSSSEFFLGGASSDFFSTDNISRMVFHQDSVKGCMDPFAVNYNPIALISDSDNSVSTRTRDFLFSI